MMIHPFTKQRVHIVLAELRTKFNFQVDNVYMLHRFRCLRCDDTVTKTGIGRLRWISSTRTRHQNGAVHGLSFSGMLFNVLASRNRVALNLETESDPAELMFMKTSYWSIDSYTFWRKTRVTLCRFLLTIKKNMCQSLSSGECGSIEPCTLHNILINIRDRVFSQQSPQGGHVHRNLSNADAASQCYRANISKRHQRIMIESRHSAERHPPKATFQHFTASERRIFEHFGQLKVEFPLF